MNNEIKQKCHELRVFKDFTKICPLKIDPDSIKKGNEREKEPDIICQLRNGDKLAFELTEAVDSSVPRKLDISHEAERIWNQYYKDLLPNDKLRFDRLFDGCSISLTIEEKASKQDVRNSVTLLLNKFKNYFRDDLGLIHRISSDDLPEGCECLTIEPYGAEPKFRCSRAGGISANFVLNKIEKKFKKKYESSCPIHLLVHSDHHSLGPDCIWLATTKGYVEQNLVASPFKRIWVFDRCSSEIPYVFPNWE